MRPPEGRDLRGTCNETEDATVSQTFDKRGRVREALALKQRMQPVVASSPQRLYPRVREALALYQMMQLVPF